MAENGGGKRILIPSTPPILLNRSLLLLLQKNWLLFYFTLLLYYYSYGTVIGFKMKGDEYYRWFSADCTPLGLSQTDKHTFTCKVIQGCKVNLKRPMTSQPWLVPGAVDDIVADTITSLSRGDGTQPPTYHINTNITFTAPHSVDSFNNTRGFDLTLLNKASNEYSCFILYLPNIHSDAWTEELRQKPPKFIFQSRDYFNWGAEYEVDIKTLPEDYYDPNNPTNFRSKHIRMPNHPVVQFNLQLSGWIPRKGEEPPPEEFDCADPKYVNLRAYKWTGTYSKILVKVYSETINVNFFAAPPHYCFEEYEIRLHPKGSTDILQTQIIPADKLKERVYGNITVKEGTHVFTEVKVGEYDIGVIPVERSKQFYPKRGIMKCLCPTMAVNDISHHDKIVCACTESKWSDVSMKEPTKLPVPEENCLLNPETCDGGPRTENRTIGGGADTIYVFAGLATFGMLAILIGLLILAVFYGKFRKRGGRSGRVMRFRPANMSDGGGDEWGTELGDVLKLTPEKLKAVKVLIVYNHDSTQHERAVAALAEYLQRNCFCDVELDTWAIGELIRNKHDWVFGSIQRADKVLVVNSEGAFKRWQNRLIEGSTGYSTKLTEPSPSFPTTTSTPAFGGTTNLNDLFLLQLDIASQIFNSPATPQTDPKSSGYNKFLSVYFEYTGSEYLLRNVSPLIRFCLPAKLDTLAANLHNVTPTHPALETVNPRDYLRTAEGLRLFLACRDALETQRGNSQWLNDWAKPVIAGREMLAVVPSGKGGDGIIIKDDTDLIKTKLWAATTNRDAAVVVADGGTDETGVTAAAALTGNYGEESADEKRSSVASMAMIVLGPSSSSSSSSSSSDSSGVHSLNHSFNNNNNDNIKPTTSQQVSSNQITENGCDVVHGMVVMDNDHCDWDRNRNEFPPPVHDDMAAEHNDVVGGNEEDDADVHCDSGFIDSAAAANSLAQANDYRIQQQQQDIAQQQQQPEPQQQQQHIFAPSNNNTNKHNTNNNLSIMQTNNKNNNMLLQMNNNQEQQEGTGVDKNQVKGENQQQNNNNNNNTMNSSEFDSLLMNSDNFNQSIDISSSTSAAAAVLDLHNLPPSPLTPPPTTTTTPKMKKNKQTADKSNYRKMDGPSVVSATASIIVHDAIRSRSSPKMFIKHRRNNSPAVATTINNSADEDQRQLLLLQQQQD